MQIQEFLRPDGKARVELYVREDGTYSFVEETLESDENPFTGEHTVYWYQELVAAGVRLWKSR